MARTAEGWRLVWKRGVAHVRFRAHGRRHEISTRERDSLAASRVATEIYADFVSGRLTRAASGALVHPGTSLDGICADWIADIAPELGEGTDTTYEVYARHWAKHFRTIGAVNVAAIATYQRDRLRTVQRSTVIKERSALLRFLIWCHEKGCLRDVPALPKLSKKAPGKKHKQGRSKPRVDLSPAEVAALLTALPEWSLRSKAGKRFAVRDYFLVCYETALRPEGTVDRLLGSDLTLAGLHIRPECDKNRWERTVPLSRAARSALKRQTTKADKPIFGVHDRRVVFRKACVEALGPERGNLVSPYDLKHARVTHWFDAGASTTAVAFMTGTRAALVRYTQPSRRAAEGLFGGHSGAVSSDDECEGPDLNRDGSYPASTSSKSVSADGLVLSSESSSHQPESTVLNSLSGAGHPIGFSLLGDSLRWGSA